MKNRYADGMLYEIFIRRAYGYQTSELKNGADVSLFTNLANAANGKKTSFLPTYDKQFTAVKGHIDKAITKFIDRKPMIKETEAYALRQLQEKLQSASQIDALMEIVDEGLSITQAYK